MLLRDPPCFAGSTTALGALLLAASLFSLAVLVWRLANPERCALQTPRRHRALALGLALVLTVLLVGLYGRAAG